MSMPHSRIFCGFKGAIISHFHIFLQKKTISELAIFPQVGMNNTFAPTSPQVSHQVEYIILEKKKR
jgi:hypothetical protein